MTGRFSPFVIKALTDLITGGAGQGPDITEPIGIYRSGPKIEALFLDCGLDMRIGSSSRVPATTQFLRDLARQWDGDDHMKRVILRVCDPREYISAPDKAVAVRQHLNAALEADGLAVTIVSGTAHLVERTSAGLIVEPFISKVTKLDFDTVQIEIARALPSSQCRSRRRGHSSMLAHRSSMPLDLDRATFAAAAKARYRRIAQSGAGAFGTLAGPHRPACRDRAGCAPSARRAHVRYQRYRCAAYTWW